MQLDIESGLVKPEDAESVIAHIREGHCAYGRRDTSFRRANECKPEVPTTLRKRTRGHHLTLDERIEVAHMVFVKKEYVVDVARHFRVTPAAISSQTCNLEKKPELLAELLSARAL